MDKKNVATKVATKKVEKKAPAKKVVSKKSVGAGADPKRLLVYASEGNTFWLNNGEILNSLISLHDALAEMDKDLYSYHVNDLKHDFADWVEHVLCDIHCANDLREAKTAKGAKTVVGRYLKSYQV